MWLVEATAFGILMLLPHAGTFLVDYYCSDINGSWYSELRKPQCVIPNGAFQAAWIVVLTGMGLASYLIWKIPDESKLPLLTFYMQLAITWAWTPLFFYLKSPKAGLVDLAVLVPTVDVCTFQFFEKSITAGLLMIPYSVWLVYIAWINYRLYDLNKDEG